MDFLLTSNDSSFNEQLSRIFIRAVENRVTDPFPGKNSQARSTKPKLLTGEIPTWHLMQATSISSSIQKGADTRTGDLDRQIDFYHYAKDKTLQSGNTTEPKARSHWPHHCQRDVSSFRLA